MNGLDFQGKNDKKESRPCIATLQVTIGSGHAFYVNE